jgi:hypothetical protein
VRTFLAFVVVALFAPSVVAAEQPRSTENPCADRANRKPRLMPVDEASSTPDFAAYRARLLAAVNRRDVDAVVDAADPGIRLGFDASGGRDALRKLFAETSESWEELRAVLALGGSFSSPSAFAAPYVYSRWPEAFDSFECAAVIGRNVRLRAAPRLDAPIMTSLSYSIVQVLQSGADEQWPAVQRGDGRSGYIWHAYVRSPVDYRALFNRIDGRWRMTAFVAGD